MCGGPRWASDVPVLGARVRVGCFDEGDARPQSVAGDARVCFDRTIVFFHLSRFRLAYQPTSTHVVVYTRGIKGKSRHGTVCSCATDNMAHQRGEQAWHILQLCDGQYGTSKRGAGTDNMAGGLDAFGRLVLHVRVQGHGPLHESLPSGRTRR